MSFHELWLQRTMHFGRFMSIVKRREKVSFVKLGSVAVNKIFTSKDIVSSSSLVSNSLTLSKNCMKDLMEWLDEYTKCFSNLVISLDKLDVCVYTHSIGKMLRSWTEGILKAPRNFFELGTLVNHQSTNSPKSIQSINQSGESRINIGPGIKSVGYTIKIEADNDKLKVNNKQWRLMSTGQAVSHMWWNSNTSLLPEVCVDVIQKNNESSTTIPSSSENETPKLQISFTI